MKIALSLAATLVLGLHASAQEPNQDQPSAEPASPKFQIEPGTKIPMRMINSVSTKQATVGQSVYLETTFPILSGGRIVIPPGSYVSATITDVKRPGRVKGRGELYLRFDSLTLPNGTTRNFRARIATLDGRASEELDTKEGKIRSEGNKAGDAGKVAAIGASGASIGAIAGSASGHTGMGAGIGAAAGATAGLVGVLLTRGPEAVLAAGTSMEMTLDRPITYESRELNFGPDTARRSSYDAGGPPPSTKSQSGLPRRRFPL